MIWIETSRRHTGFYQLLTFSPRVLVFTLFVLRTFSQTKENHKLNLIVNFEPPQCEYCPVISSICIQHIYLHFTILVNNSFCLFQSFTTHHINACTRFNKQKYRHSCYVYVLLPLNSESLIEAGTKDNAKAEQ